MRKLSAWILIILCLTFSMPGIAETSFTAGTYEATVASVGGPLTVQVTVDETKILSVEVTEINDTTGVYDEVVARIPASVVEYQTANVDTVSGATLSSIFMRNAITEALKQAGTLSSDKAPAYTAPAQEDTEADVVVVGGGTAGIAAALAAADHGLDVVLLERLGYLGGFFLVSGQGASTYHSGFPNNVENMVSQMQKLGVEMVDTPVDIPGYRVKSVLSYPDNGVDNFSNYYVKKGLEVMSRLNVRMMTETPATGLLVEDGSVVGVTAQPRGQEPFTIHAKAVILATGGFNDNPELVAKYLPFAAGARAVTLGGTKGDALIWTEPLNAKLYGMDAGHASWFNVSPTTGYSTQESVVICYYLTLDGELITEPTINSWDPQKVYQTIGNQPYYVLQPHSSVEAVQLVPTYEHMVLAGTLQRFDSLKEMAEALELPKLLETAEQCGLEEGPYYIGKSVAGIYGVYGGLATDDGCRLLTKDDAVIPGLYGAGEVLGNRIYWNEGIYRGAVGEAMISGNLAGNTAAEDIGK